MVEAEVRQAERTPCFWLRGLLPDAWVEVPEPPQDREAVIFEERAQAGRSPHRAADMLAERGALGQVFAEGQIWFAGDTSEGSHGSHRRLKRSSWGLAAVCHGADRRL